MRRLSHTCNIQSKVCYFVHFAFLGWLWNNILGAKQCLCTRYT